MVDCHLLSIAADGCARVAVCGGQPIACEAGIRLQPGRTASTVQPNAGGGCICIGSGARELCHWLTHISSGQSALAEATRYGICTWDPPKSSVPDPCHCWDRTAAPSATEFIEGPLQLTQAVQDPHWPSLFACSHHRNGEPALLYITMHCQWLRQAQRATGPAAAHMSGAVPGTSVERRVLTFSSFPFLHSSLMPFAPVPSPLLQRTWCSIARNVSD